MNKLITMILFIIFTPFIMQAQGWFSGVGFIPGAASSRVDAISPNGRYLAGQSNGAFFWRIGSPNLIDMGDSTWQAKGVSDNGYVAGIGSIGGTIAFRWHQDSGLINLGNLGGEFPEARAFGISADGDIIVGWSWSSATQEAFRWTEGGGIASLGLLPGGYQHEAMAVSGDGSIAVGFGRDANQELRAILWNGGATALPFLVDSLPNNHRNIARANDITPDGTIIVGESYHQCIINICYDQAVIWRGGSAPQPLDFLPAYDRSRGLAVSGDGSVIVGNQAIHNSSMTAVIWDSSGQVREMKELLENDYGVNLTGWHLIEATDISANGKVIVGRGTNPNGQQEGWVAVLGISIVEPAVDSKLIAGTRDTIRWVGGIPGSLLEIEYSTDDGSTFELIDLGAEVDSGYYAWDVPEDLLTTKAQINVADWNNVFIADTTENFRIKPYIITKLDENDNYVAYDILTDRWGFGNNENDMWPQSWWQQFNYNGIDPITNSQYSLYQGFYVFAFASASDFPDWPTFVRTFGVDACYISTSLGIYSPTALSQWRARKGNWRGSCYGISTSNALVFNHKEEFTNNYPQFPSFTTPISVTSGTNVIPVMSELFLHQFGNPSREHRNSRWRTITPNETLHEIKEMLYADEVGIKTLSIFNNNGSGAHSILPYELEQDEAQEELYYLYVYDNAYPNNTSAIILFDTTANNNRGEWLPTYAWTDWGGDSLIVLELEAPTFLNNPTFPKNRGGYLSPFIKGADELEVYAGIAANTKIYDTFGNLTGFDGNSVFSEIPNSLPLSYLNGSETPPYGYLLLSDNYSIEISNSATDTIATFFFSGNKTFVYERNGATVGETDRLFFDGGISVGNPDSGDRTVSLANIINESTQEKLFALRSLSLATGDSLKIENVNTDQLRLISYGSAKSYEIELNFAADTSLERYGRSGIALDENTTHTFIVDWENTTTAALTVLVDNGNNGSIDDTLSLATMLDIDAPDHSSLPNAYQLAQNYPNPFNPATNITFSLPKATQVSLTVYNVLGQPVTTLAHGRYAAGVHTVKFNAEGLSSGVYLYRLETEGIVKVRKMLLIR